MPGTGVFHNTFCPVSTFHCATAPWPSPLPFLSPRNPGHGRAAVRTTGLDGTTSGFGGAAAVDARTIHLPTADVKTIREHFGLSQAEFAIRFGFEADTIQNWEQGRNRPDQATQLLLKVIEAHPDDVEAILTGYEGQRRRP